MKIKYILMFFVLLCIGYSHPLTGQSKIEKVTVTSVVEDDSGTPIKDVLVSGEDGIIQTRTDALGRFSISVSWNSYLFLEKIGYASQYVSIRDVESRTSLVMEKESFLQGAADEVNIAFGKVKRKEVIGAVSTLTPEQLREFDRTESIQEILLGKIPGLLGSTNIRGLGETTIIVDGITRDIDNLNISEIDQITILKDGNAAMLWGTRARGGVIQITTKRGTPYRRKIDFSVDQGFSTPVVLPKYLSAGEYFKFYNEARQNDNNGVPNPAYSDDLINAYTNPNRNIYRYPDVDYYSDEYLNQWKNSTRFLAEFSGGNDNTRYYANLGWTRSTKLQKAAEGMADNRFNMRANVDFKITDFIKSSIDAVFIFDADKRPSGNFWGNAATLHPHYFSPLLPISAVKDTPALKAILETAKIIDGQYILGGTSAYMDNPYGNRYLAGHSTLNERTASVNNTIDVDLSKITSGLSFKTNFSFDTFNEYAVTVNNTYAVYTPTWDNDEISGLAMHGQDQSSGVQNMPVQQMDFIRRIGVYALLNYEKVMNMDHSLNATLLGYWNSIKYNGVLGDSKYAHLGLRVTYDYKKKYFADFSSTYTNGFRLPPGKRGGYAPSLGLAWLVSEEDFINAEWIDFLKVRASGTIQKLDLDGLGTEWVPYEDYFAWTGSRFSYGDGRFNPQGTTALRSPNPNLTFEKATTWNAGVEGYFFNKLLYVDANVFTQLWSGRVIRQYNYYPALLGIYYPYENYNANRYSGAELGITVSESVGDFSFDIGVNALYAIPKTVKVSEVWGEDYLYRQGKPDDAIFGLESVGFFADQTDINNSPAQTFGIVKPGDIKYKDQNGDNKIDNNDQIQIGNSQTRFSYGLNILLRYKNVSLMATGDARTGYQYIQNGNYFWVDGNDKYSEAVLDRWTPETAQTATYPRLSAGTNENNYRASTFWLKNGDYFRLNRVQLTYNVPTKSIQWMKDLSIYVRGSNLFMWSENAKQRQLNIGGEPNYHTYSLGFNVKF